MTIALPSRGRLALGAALLAQKAGIEIARPERSLQTTPPGSNLRVIFVHHRDCGMLVEGGWADVGITAEDILEEHGNDVVRLSSLHFAACRIVVAVHEDSGISNIGELVNATIATKYPQLTTKWFSKRGLEVKVKSLYGAIEVAPGIGFADAIVDSYDSGATAMANHLRVLETVMHSEAVLIGKQPQCTDSEYLLLVERLVAAKHLIKSSHS